MKAWFLAAAFALMAVFAPAQAQEAQAPSCMTDELLKEKLTGAPANGRIVFHGKSIQYGEELVIAVADETQRWVLAIKDRGSACWEAFDMGVLGNLHPNNEVNQ